MHAIHKLAAIQVCLLFATTQAQALQCDLPWDETFNPDPKIHPTPTVRSVTLLDLRSDVDFVLGLTYFSPLYQPCTNVCPGISFELTSSDRPTPESFTLDTVRQREIRILHGHKLTIRLTATPQGVEASGCIGLR